MPLTEEAREALQRALGTRISALPDSRAVPPENWHITLRFLGEIPLSAKDRIVATLRAGDLPPAFEVSLSGFGAFPRASAAQVVWAGIDDPAGFLGAMNAAAEKAAGAAGLKPEGRRYTPHVTLGRLRSNADVRPLLDGLGPFEFPLGIPSVVLFRSHLGPGGARYEAVEKVSLRG